MSKAAELAALIGSQSALSNRNLVINGAMQVAQRGTSFDAAEQYLCDRWRFGRQTDGYDLTWAQSTTTPDGFGNSLKMDVTTADTSLNANVFALLQQRFEGQNLQMLKKGTSAAESVTVSFFVRSAKTGTYIVELTDQDNSTRHINKSYTINSADTWEYKSITFAGDTTGALDNDANRSLNVNWWLAAGTDFSSGTLATSWQTLDATDRAVGQVNIFDSTSNDWYITGVQMELGEQATPFEHRSFADELYRCKRYFQKSFNYDTAPENGGSSDVSFNGGLLSYCGSNNNGAFSGFHRFDPEMRATPTITTFGNSSGHWGSLSPTNTGTTSFSSGAGFLTNTKASGVNFGQNVSGDTLLIGFGHLTADAEL